MHLCEQPMNITKRACCQLVQLLNDTSRVPPCHPDFLSEVYNASRLSYKPPIWLSEPTEVHEDHATFLLGILILMLIAIGCAFTLSKITKPKVEVGYPTGSNYDFMMWLPSSTSSRNNRRNSMMVMLRGITCRRPTTANRSSSISVVSSNIGLLPSYQTAASAPTVFGSQPPPPPYSEVQQLNEEDQQA